MVVFCPSFSILSFLYVLMGGQGGGWCGKKSWRPDVYKLSQPITDRYVWIKREWCTPQTVTFLHLPEMWISKQYICTQEPLLNTQSHLLKSQIQNVALNTSGRISKQSAVVPVSERGSASSSATSSCFVAHLPLWPSNAFLCCNNGLKLSAVGAFCSVISHWSLLSDSEQPSASSSAVLTLREVDFCDGVQLSRTSLDSFAAVLQWTEGKLGKKKAVFVYDVIWKLLSTSGNGNHTHI